MMKWVIRILLCFLIINNILLLNTVARMLAKKIIMEYMTAPGLAFIRGQLGEYGNNYKGTLDQYQKYRQQTDGANDFQNITTNYPQPGILDTANSVIIQDYSKVADPYDKYHSMIRNYTDANKVTAIYPAAARDYFDSRNGLHENRYAFRDISNPTGFFGKR